jgi:ABC-type bacteriocin/lantibiotic exporter with double-glycine peptidase domain
MKTNPMKSILSIGITSVLLGFFAAGCQQPKEKVHHYPRGALQVPYEGATSHTTCLVASTAMAANYLEGQHTYSEQSMLRQLKQMGMDETRVGALKQFLARDGLHLLAFKGDLDDKPPLGLEYLLEKRGYPVICVINYDESGDPDYNHAVVVIGISENPGPVSTDVIHYFDPVSQHQLHTVDDATFKQMWARSGQAMMIVTRAPKKDPILKESE